MGKTLLEVFANLASFYKEQVDEADEAGFADFYWTCTEAYFDAMREEGFTPTDIEYLDGYFLMSTGTNSIVHFRVKECPGWLFGIWWEQPKADSTNLSGELFAQYEETIDKFKPSASVLTDTVFVYERGCNFSYNGKYFFDFIKNEPYLAFCRDYLYWDYNREYHSREEAKAEYDKWRAERDKRLAAEKEYNDLLLKTIIDFTRDALEEGESLYMYDLGKNISPRYYFYVLSPQTPKEDEHYIDLREYEAWAPVQELIDSYNDQGIYLHSYNYRTGINVRHSLPEPLESYTKLL